MTTKIEWQPIETAPKDGTPILVIGDEQTTGRYMKIARFDRTEGMFIADGPGVTTVGHAYLTHWAPRPDFPEIFKEKNHDHEN